MCLSRSEAHQGDGGGRKTESSDAVATVSYDEKPGIQAIATTAPDLPREPSRHATFARDHEYKRHGVISLLAGIDLITGQVLALVKDRSGPGFRTAGLVGGSLLRMALNGAEHDEGKTEN